MASYVDLLIKLCVFFFQAEDGIRDHGVTGVQTCALPIYGNVFESAGAMQCVATPETTSVYPSGAAFATRSEPMTPPAPARFSTMKFSFRVSLSLCDTRRPRVSAGPPAAKGKTLRPALGRPPCPETRAGHST